MTKIKFSCFFLSIVLLISLSVIIPLAVQGASTGGYSISVSPNAAHYGDKVTVSYSFKALSNGHYYLRFCEIGTPTDEFINEFSLDSKYNNGMISGSNSVTMPRKDGSFEFRVFCKLEAFSLIKPALLFKSPTITNSDPSVHPAVPAGPTPTLIRPIITPLLFPTIRPLVTATPTPPAVTPEPSKTTGPLLPGTTLRPLRPTDPSPTPVPSATPAPTATPANVTPPPTTENPPELKDTIVFQVGNPMMMINGEIKEIDPGKGTSPVVFLDRTLLPIRALIESIGGTVAWEESEEKVTINQGGNKIYLWINKNAANVNGNEKTLDVPPQEINSRTMVPLRFVSENLGFEILWDSSSQTITIGGK